MNIINSLKKEAISIIFLILFLIFMPMLAVFLLIHPDSVKATSNVVNLNSYPNDYYAWGNCTWWVSIRRSQVGLPIPNNWGNAATWAEAAKAAGYLVDHSPAQYAIMQTANVDNGLGHVAFIESLNPNGSFNISEMNVLGLDIVDYKTMPAAAVNDYLFIH